MNEEASPSIDPPKDAVEPRGLCGTYWVYAQMSPEEKAQFDEKLDRCIPVIIDGVTFLEDPKP